MLTELLGATYNPYKPAVLDWPVLDAAAKARITALPIWDMAVQAENKAGARIEFFSQTIKDKKTARGFGAYGGRGAAPPPGAGKADRIL